MSPCETLPEQAPDYHSGALTAADAARYESHLSSCPSCQRADEQYRQGLELLLPWPAEMPLEMIVLRVSFPMWIILVPVSACWCPFTTATE